MGKTYQERLQREYIPLAHVSAVANGEKCGYGAVISLSVTDRRLIFGVTDKNDAAAYAVYAELKAVLEIIRIYKENNIKTARIKFDREKALLAMAEKEDIKGCAPIVKQIRDAIGDRDYTFALEEENKEGLSYIMAERAVGKFRYKNGYKWKPEYEKYTSELFQFTIKEFYTRKTHDDYEYLNLAKLLEQYDGPKKDITLPLNVVKEITLYTSQKNIQTIASMFYLCGLDPKTACKCARIAYMTHEHGENDLNDEIRRRIKILTLEKNSESRSASLTNDELKKVIDLVMDRYYKNLYPLRTLKEAVTGVFLDVLSERDPGRVQTPHKVNDTPATKSKPVTAVTCSVCGNEIKKTYFCNDSDIAKILKNKGYDNRFCSIGCFAKATELKTN